MLLVQQRLPDQHDCILHTAPKPTAAASTTACAAVTSSNLLGDHNNEHEHAASTLPTSSCGFAVPIFVKQL
jgi:hypothetical protein